MDFIKIRNVETRRELLAIRSNHPTNRYAYYSVTQTNKDPIEVPVRSVRKVIRAWMKENK